MKGKLKLLSGKRIESPLHKKTRPTSSKVREAIINILGDELNGASWLDLCSGSGSMACEAIQNGVEKVLAIEKHWKEARTCKRNLIDVSNCIDHSVQIEVRCSELILFLKKRPKIRKIDFMDDDLINEKKFDFIFLDPPYDSELYEVSQELLLSKKWVNQSSTLICECSSKSMPGIHNGWQIQKEKVYGKTALLFLTPSQASNYFDDTDSKH